MLTAPDQQIVIERDLGDTIVEISWRHRISHQRVSVITRRGMNLQLESRRAHTSRGWRGVVMAPAQRRPRSNASAAASSSSSTEEVVAA